MSYRWLNLGLLSLAIADPRKQAQERLIDRELTNRVEQVIRSAARLKPGMTRKDVFADFQEEGGLSTRREHRYVLRACSYIKIDVTFRVSQEQLREPEQPTDVIEQVSRPYLELGVMD